MGVHDISKFLLVSCLVGGTFRFEKYILQSKYNFQTWNDLTFVSGNKTKTPSCCTFSIAIFYVYLGIALLLCPQHSLRLLNNFTNSSAVP